MHTHTHVCVCVCARAHALLASVHSYSCTGACMCMLSDESEGCLTWQVSQVLWGLLQAVGIYLCVCVWMCECLCALSSALPVLSLVRHISAKVIATAMAIMRCQWRHHCVVTLGKCVVVLVQHALQEQWYLSLSEPGLRLLLRVPRELLLLRKDKFPFRKRKRRWSNFRNQERTTVWIIVCFAIVVVSALF